MAGGVPPRMTSGATQEKVPAGAVLLRYWPLMSSARPTSEILAVPSPPMSTLQDLRSRWTTLHTRQQSPECMHPEGMPILMQHTL